jgi:hypothetical protein
MAVEKKTHALRSSSPPKPPYATAPLMAEEKKKITIQTARAADLTAFPLRRNPATAGQAGAGADGEEKNKIKQQTSIVFTLFLCHFVTLFLFEGVGLDLRGTDCII